MNKIFYGVLFVGLIGLFAAAKDEPKTQAPTPITAPAVVNEPSSERWFICEIDAEYSAQFYGVTEARLQPGGAIVLSLYDNDESLYYTPRAGESCQLQGEEQ
jgi:hypothetical protein